MTNQNKKVEFEPIVFKGKEGKAFKKALLEDRNMIFNERVRMLNDASDMFVRNKTLEMLNKSVQEVTDFMLSIEKQGMKAKFIDSVVALEIGKIIEDKNAKLVDAYRTEIEHGIKTGDIPQGFCQGVIFKQK